eukprot:GDKK01027745.1.p1 GENE.GDKK01027745.1~~GDKK01027745.1.p1  ORF type:complete len:451 (+),score=72.01 GDKK01027745.1:28-1353(+)
MSLSKEYENHLKLVAKSMEEPSKEEHALKQITTTLPAINKSANSTRCIEPLWITNAPDVMKLTDHDRPRRASIQLDHEVFSVSFSPDSELLVGTCGNGDIRVWGVDNSREKMTLKAGGSENYPVMCSRWRPAGVRVSSGYSSTKNVLLSAGGDGRLIHWHVPSAKILSEIWTPHNSLYACDFSCDASKFFSAGKDGVIRAYDEQTKQLISQHSGGREPMAAGHSLTVFAMKCHTTEPNLLVSAGWDNTIQLWDIRAGDQAVNSIRNVEVRGEGLDFSQDGRHLLIANTRSSFGLQMADFNSFAITENIQWGSRRGATPPTSLADSSSSSTQISVKNPPLYSAKFSKDDNSSMILAGGGGNGLGVDNEALLFDRRIIKSTTPGDPNFEFYDPKSIPTVQYSCAGQICGLQRSVFSVDFAPNFSKLAIASGDGVIRVLKISGF